MYGSNNVCLVATSSSPKCAAEAGLPRAYDTGTKLYVFDAFFGFCLKSLLIFIAYALFEVNTKTPAICCNFIIFTIPTS